MTSVYKQRMALLVGEIIIHINHCVHLKFSVNVCVTKNRHTASLYTTTVVQSYV